MGEVVIWSLVGVVGWSLVRVDDWPAEEVAGWLFVVFSAMIVVPIKLLFDMFAEYWT